LKTYFLQPRGKLSVETRVTGENLQNIEILQVLQINLHYLKPVGNQSTQFGSKVPRAQLQEYGEICTARDIIICYLFHILLVCSNES